MSEVLYNSISAECTVVPCINQVAGYYDNNPVAQLSACQSIFGIPAVATVTQTLPAEDTFWTRTSTYTDVVIIVTTSTAYSTAQETSTAYETSYSTTTEYTRTVTNTVSATVTAPALLAKKRKLRRRGQCKPKTTTSTTISDEPAATATTSDLSAIPSNCPNLAAYSSACACIEPRTVTRSAEGVMSIIDEAVTVTAPSTIGAVLTVGVTTVVIKPATTTLVSTLKTEAVTTTTATSTVIPALPNPTVFNLRILNGEYLTVAGNPNQGYTFAVAGTAPPSDSGVFSLPAGSSTAALRTLPNYSMFTWVATNTNAYVGKVIFNTVGNTNVVSGTWAQPSCSISSTAIPGSLYFSCVTAFHNRFFRCGSEIYLTNNVTPAQGCYPVILTAVRV